MKIKVKARLSQAEEIKISTEFIKLDAFLKFANVAITGGEAKEMITQGAVEVNGAPCLQRGRKLRDGDRVRVFNNTFAVKVEE